MVVFDKCISSSFSRTKRSICVLVRKRLRPPRKLKTSHSHLILRFHVPRSAFVKIIVIAPFLTSNKPIRQKMSSISTKFLSVVAKI